VYLYLYFFLVKQVAAMAIVQKLKNKKINK